MKTLKTIQKTCNVFRILAKVAMILSFVWAGLVLVGVVCAFALKNGEAGLPMHTMLSLTGSSTVGQMLGALAAEFVFGITDGILFLLAYRYFCKETEDGTPFTADGAEQLKKLGIFTIVLPIISIAIAAIIYGVSGVDGAENLSNSVSLILGIAMILFSLVLRCGAEIMGNNIHRLPAEKNNLK